MDNIFVTVESFFSKFTDIHYPKNHIVWRAYENPNGILFLKTGYVRMYTISDNGNELNLHIFQPKSFLPMIWALNNISNAYYFDTLSEISGWLAPKDAFVQFLKEHNDVLFNLTQRSFMGMNGLLTRISSLTFDKADQRIISVLIWLAKHFSVNTDNQIQFSIAFTHKDIAAFAGLTRETTSRELERLQKEGLIEFRNHMYMISDLEKLKAKLPNEAF